MSEQAAALVSRETLLGELRERAADRPVHAKALEQIIAWYERWHGNENAAPNDPTEGLPRGVSGRVAEALDTDVVFAFDFVPGQGFGSPPRAYNARRRVDAQGAAKREVTLGSMQHLLNPGGE